ncbi:hypothetical protein LTR37_019222 [Vermiconidia calcicola]|uniref:Uncharacterized protein n=1 Tax=Vermiconidia calcicola TaxID=1690605 RepID=A0ACC3MEQ0_9PEZI|nr:hypothetical protein LTR37_019222 [Vermiconidia calcicola]
MTDQVANREVKLPRITIKYCTQCKWMLRSAWMQQELLSTFQTSIGEIALVPSTGGLFQVRLTYVPQDANGQAVAEAKDVLIWDRKVEGGFPEAKILKQKIRNHIEPDKSLGHSDTPSSKVNPNSQRKEGSAEGSTAGRDQQPGMSTGTNEPACEDCI